MALKGSSKDASDEEPQQEENSVQWRFIDILRCSFLCMLNLLPQDPTRRAALISFIWALLGWYMYTSSPWNTNDNFYSNIDAFYVMAQIITTVGYGDMCAGSEGHLLLTSLYVLVAVAVMSSVVGAVADRVIRQQEQMLQNAVDKIRVEEVMEASQRIQQSVQDALDQAGGSPEAKAVVVKVSEAVEASAQAIATTEVSEVWTDFLRSFCIWASFVFAWVVFFWVYPGEGKSFNEAFYMAVVTLTTVGFGDRTPVTQGGRAFASVSMILGVGAFANMVAKFSSAFLSRDVQIKGLDRDALEAIWKDEHFKRCSADLEEDFPRIQRNDFIVFMLQRMKLIDENAIIKLSQNFDALDANGNGFLDESDILRRNLQLPRIQLKRHLTI